jgi:putative transposase
MPRRARSITGGYLYHVLNRANARATLFKKRADYEAFERVLEQAFERVPLRILSYCVMPNHWHFVVWPKRGQGKLVSDFFHWLTLTHTQRWHAHYHSSGTGHVYQGRFKSFPIESDDHLHTVNRYVERNSLRANLVERAEDWQWSSLWRHQSGDKQLTKLLSEGPIARPHQWLKYVNRALTVGELNSLRQCGRRGAPYGSEDWCKRTIKRLGLEHTIRAPGRPRKASSP